MNRLGKCFQKYFVKALDKGDIHENLNLEKLSGCLNMDAFHLINLQLINLDVGDVFALLFRLHCLCTCEGDREGFKISFISFIQR